MKIPYLAVLISASFLAACGGGGEPSEKDIMKATQKQVETLIANSSGWIDGDDYKIYEIKKIGCSEDGNGYACDIETDMERPMIGRQKTTTRVRLVKGDDDWVIIE